jgi:uncharacterized membrane protein YhiD involved in acid resistance
METGFDTIFALSLEPGQMVANLVMALICGLTISLTYRLTSESLNYSPTFVRANVVLAMITALVIMVIGNNLARAFGLVGAMSIIRFRTAVKDVQDIVYIFFSLAAGMAAGVGLRGIALLGTLMICTILILLQRIRYADPSKNQFLVQFQCTLPEGEPPYLPAFRRWSTKARLANMRSLGVGDLFELTFYIELKDKTRRNDLVRELNQIASVSNIRLYADDIP